MFDIEDFLFRQFDPVPYGHPQSDWRMDCPFCNDSKGHLHVAISKQTCHCFRCDYSATWLGLVMDITGLPYYKALGELYVIPNPRDWDRVSELLASSSAEPKNSLSKADLSLPEGFIPLWEGDGAGAKFTLDMVRGYLQRRHIFADDWERYSLGYVPTVGPRVFIPIEGDYWHARAIFPWQEPKYIGPQGIPSETVLSHSVSLYMYDEVVITEGVFSGISIGPNHVSLVGKNPTPGKVARLVQAPVKHYIITVESGADEPMLALADQLVAADKRVTVWKYEHGDPADSKPTYMKAYDFGTKIEMLLSQPVGR